MNQMKKRRNIRGTLIDILIVLVSSGITINNTVTHIHIIPGAHIESPVLSPQ